MSDEPDAEIGEIVNHTHVLDMGEIRQVVTERVLAQIGEGVVGKVEPVHVAPADDNKLLTKAARAWRGASGEELEFTDNLGSTKLFWFGIRYSLQTEDSASPEADVPKQWPPEGSEAEQDEQAPDPQIAEQLDIDEDELEDGFGEIREE